MFYKQLLQEQITKAQRRQSSCQPFLAILGFVSSKAARRALMKLTPDVTLRENMNIDRKLQIRSSCFW